MWSLEFLKIRGEGKDREYGTQGGGASVKWWVLMYSDPAGLILIHEFIGTNSRLFQVWTRYGLATDQGQYLLVSSLLPRVLRQPSHRKQDIPEESLRQISSKATWRKEPRNKVERIINVEIPLLC